MFEIIVARNLDKAIGYKNKLLYSIKKDQLRFKQITENHKVIMGRKTLESLPFKNGFPNRYNIVLTKNKDLIGSNDNIEFCNDVKSIINKYKYSNEIVYVVGGESIYNQFLPYADYLNITEIYDAKYSFDSKFEFNKDEFKQIWLGNIKQDEKTGINFQYVRYKRLK